MKNAILIIIISFLTFACNSKATKTEKVTVSKELAEEKEPIKKDIKHLHNEIEEDTVKGYKYDFHDKTEKKFKYYYTETQFEGRDVRIIKDMLKSDSLMINGVFTNKSSEKELLSMLGDADSVRNVRNEMYNFEIIEYYYPNMKFEMHSYDSIVEFQTIEFQADNNFIKYGDLILNSETKLSELKDIFPLSYLNAEKSKKHKVDNNKTIKTDWLRFRTAKEYETDDQFIMVFYNNELKYIWHWVPN